MPYNIRVKPRDSASDPEGAHSKELFFCHHYLPPVTSIPLRLLSLFSECYQ